MFDRERTQEKRIGFNEDFFDDFICPFACSPIRKHRNFRVVYFFQRFRQPVTVGDFNCCVHRKFSRLTTTVRLEWAISGEKYGIRELGVDCQSYRIVTNKTITESVVRVHYTLLIFVAFQNSNKCLTFGWQIMLIHSLCAR